MAGSPGQIRPQKRRVLRADAIAAPPEHAVLPGDVILPGIAHARTAGPFFQAIIFQRAQKEQRAIGIVVSGEIMIFHGIILDFPAHLPDTGIAPALNGRAVPHADGFAQPAGIASFHILFYHTAYPPFMGSPRATVLSL